MLFVSVGPTTLSRMSAVVRSAKTVVRRKRSSGRRESVILRAMSAWLHVDGRPLDWNGPVGRPFTPFSDAAFERSIIDHLEHAVRRHRDRIALRDGETTLTFGELWDGLSGLAERLAADSRPGDLIGILLPPCPMFAVAMFACLAAGRPFVALDTHYPTDWLNQVLADARPARVITREDLLPRPAGPGWRPACMSLDEPACVLFTSGSTGRPKGIVNSQRNLLQRVAQSIDAAHINAEDRLLTLASPCTIAGVRDVVTAMLAGASIHLIDPLSAGVREILNTIREEAITILFAFPALLRSVATAGTTHTGARLRLIRVGGDTTLWSDIDLLRSQLAPQAAIQLIYAATEAPMLQWFVDDACRGDDVRIPIGYPLPGNHLALLDEQGRATPRGEVGELVVASSYVTLGRWVDGRHVPESAAPCGETALRLFRTGDLARQRPDGLLERVGRKDRQVKINGTRVDLDGVEAALRAHPFVRDVAALGRPGGIDGAVTLVAHVTARDAAPAGLIEELRDLMRSVPQPMRPARFYLAEKIPRLPSSKLDVRALRALDEARVESERVRDAPDSVLALRAGDPIAQTVARIWQDVLVAPVLRPDDDFFDAGGDSLKAITLTMELEAALGLKLSPTLIYEAPAFNRFCERLRERGSPRDEALVPLKAGWGSPPVFFVHGLGGNVIDILPTARRMAYRGAIIGIRARGLARGEVPHSSVEAMAADYLREIKSHQPHGPYYLCGYSFGGLVAFEMARRLEASGERVGFLGLFDTTMSPLRWPPRAWLSLISRRLPRVLRSLPARVIGVAVCSLIASARYRTGFYRGHLTLFTPVGRDSGLPALEAIWRKHARTISVVETAGNHTTMLSAPNADSTAASLTRCLSAP